MVRVITLILTLLLTPSLKANDNEDYERALKAIGKIAYKEYNLDKKVKELEKKYIDKDLKKYGGYTILVADIVINQRIKYEWKF